MTVTITPMIGGGEMAVCQTRDVSDVGLSVDTIAPFDPGTKVSITTMDQARGVAIEVMGEISRVMHGGLGIRVLEPPDDWLALVAGAARRHSPAHEKTHRRLRILVVGDDQRQRGALALYVTSGWDVRFANDLGTTDEALRGVKLDAVIAEHDASDERWQPIMAAALKYQPGARRIVRGLVDAVPEVEAELVHRFVDRTAGLEALLDALTADISVPVRVSIA